MSRVPSVEKNGPKCVYNTQGDLVCNRETHNLDSHGFKVEHFSCGCNGGKKNSVIEPFDQGDVQAPAMGGGGPSPEQLITKMATKLDGIRKRLSSLNNQ